MNKILVVVAIISTLVIGSCASSTSTVNKKGTVLRNGNGSGVTQQNY